MHDEEKKSTHKHMRGRRGGRGKFRRFAAVVVFFVVSCFDSFRFVFFWPVVFFVSPRVASG